MMNIITEWMQTCDKIFRALKALRPELDKTVNIMVNNKKALPIIKLQRPQPLYKTEVFHHLMKRFTVENACIPPEAYRPWDMHLKKLEDGRRVKWGDKTVNKKLWRETEEAYGVAKSLASSGLVKMTRRGAIMNIRYRVERSALHGMLRDIYRHVSEMYLVTGATPPDSLLRKVRKVGLDDYEERLESLVEINVERENS